MKKGSPILVDRGRSRLLAVVIVLSFAVHLGLIGLAAEGGFAIRPQPASVIAVTVLSGRPPQPAAVDDPPRKKREAKREKPPLRVAKKRNGKENSADVILPGKPTSTPRPAPTASPRPSPSLTPTPRPKPTQTPKVVATPRATPLGTATPTQRVEQVAPTAAPGDKNPTTPHVAEARPKKVPATAKSALPSESAEPSRKVLMGAAIDRVREQAGDGPVGSATGLRSGVVGSEAAGEQKGPEFMAYYGLMLERIRDAWVWGGRRPELAVTVGFKVGAAGSLSAIRVVEHSGDSSYDASVLRALRAVDPLSPPPVRYRRDFADVELIFRPADLGAGR